MKRANAGTSCAVICDTGPAPSFGLQRMIQRTRLSRYMSPCFRKYQGL